MKKLLLFSFLAVSLFFQAQKKDSVQSKTTYIKANALFLPVGILNAGIETQLSEKYTFQTDVFISPWKSFAGHEAQIYMIGFEGRYYFNKAFKHWYIGADFSTARFILQKWNYWKDGSYQYKENSPVYNKSDLYQDGYTFIFGASAGYQFEVNEKWNIDLYLGVGSSQDFYKGYHRELGIRYDTDRNWNRSGEWIPYRGGVMISYKLK
ncbi:MAG: DUF3575 domain-containing protein [Bergeyella sp.]